jgi:hypothetical protein
MSTSLSRRLFSGHKASVVIAAALLVVAEAHATTQISGTHAFLKGQHAEVGVRPNGAFGSTGADYTSISGSFNGNSSASGTGPCLGFVVSRNKNGWNRATAGVQVDGDFFCPGTPFEAWTLTVAGNTALNDHSTTDISGTLGGLVVGNSTTRHSVTWTGAAAYNGVTVQHVYSVADDGQTLRMVTTLTNTTGSPIAGIKYARLLDPDNATGTVAGSSGANTFTSTDTVVGQGSSAQIKSEFASGALIALISSDSRATVAINAGGTADAVISASAANRAIGATTTGDTRVGLAIDVGTLAAGASTTFTIEYALTAEAAGVTPRNVPVLSPAMLLLFASMLAALGVYIQRRQTI